MSPCLPVDEAFVAEKQRGSRNVPINVVVKGAHIWRAILDTVAPNRLPLLIVDEVAPEVQLESTYATALDLRSAIESEDVVLRGDIWLWCANKAPS